MTRTDPTTTPDPAVIGERERIRDLCKLGEQLRLGEDYVQRHIDAGTPFDEFRDAALERHAEMVERDPQGGDLISGPGPSMDIRQGHNVRQLDVMAEGLASRFGGGEPSEQARQYAQLSLIDFARHLLERSGISTQFMGKAQIVERALADNTTSDFSALLTETGNRILRKAYNVYQGGLKRACREAAANDFRPLNRLALGTAPKLLEVPEGGEFHHGSSVESKESYSLATYGRIFALSRKALINDDLGAFSEMGGKFGRAAAEFVASQLISLLVSNPVLNTDGVAVFDAAHGNLAATGAAPSITTLGAGVLAMRRMKDLDGTTPIDVTPKWLVVPAAQEMVARQLLTQISPRQFSDVNPYFDKLDLIVDPRLDDDSTTAWYLMADAGAIDTIEYAYLTGYPGPLMQMRQGFEIDGVEWKIQLDFGAGILDFRGLYKNPGA